MAAVPVQIPGALTATPSTVVTVLDGGVAGYGNFLLLLTR